MLSGRDEIERLLPRHRARPLVDRVPVDLEGQEAASEGRGDLAPEGKFTGRDRERDAQTASARRADRARLGGITARLDHALLDFPVGLRIARGRQLPRPGAEIARLEAVGERYHGDVLRRQGVRAGRGQCQRRRNFRQTQNRPPVECQGGRREIVQVGSSLPCGHGVGERERRRAAPGRVLGHRPATRIQRQLRRPCHRDHRAEGHGDRDGCPDRVGPAGLRGYARYRGRCRRVDREAHRTAAGRRVIGAAGEGRHHGISARGGRRRTPRFLPVVPLPT